MKGCRGLAIGAVLFLGALLRAQNLDQPWVDAYAWREADNASIADAFAAGDWNIFLPQVRWGGAGPNYLGAEFQSVTWLTALGYRIFGTHPWVGRSVAALFGLLGLFVLYRLVSEVWDRRRGLVAAAVMAVLPGSVLTERSLLSDAAMTTLLMASLWLLVLYARTRNSRWLMLATLAGTLGCLSKITGGILIVPAAYVVVTMLGPRLKEPRVLLRLASAAIATTAVVGAYYLWAAHVAVSYPPYHFTGEGKFLTLENLPEWIHERWFLPGFVATVRQFWSWPFAVFAAVGLLLPHAAVRAVGGRLFHLWAVALFARYLIEAKHLVTDPSNIHLFNPVVAAFAAHFLCVVGELRPGSVWLRRTWRAVATTLFLASASHAHLSRNLFESFYQGHHVVGMALSEVSKPDELVITMGLEPIILQHSGRRGWLFPPTEAWRLGTRERAWDYGRADLALIESLAARGATWLAIAYANSYCYSAGSESFALHYPELDRGIRARFDVVRDLPEGLILRRKPDSDPSSGARAWLAPPH